jgi:hypothetical protein
MDIFIVIAYGVMAGTAAVACVLLARVVWRKLPRHARARANRTARDRRKRNAPVLWDRRLGPRRLEDIAKGFLARVDKGANGGPERTFRSAESSG